MFPSFIDPCFGAFIRWWQELHLFPKKDKRSVHFQLDSRDSGDDIAEEFATNHQKSFYIGPHVECPMEEYYT